MGAANSVRVEVDTLLKDAGFVAAAKGAKTVGEAAQQAEKQLKDMDAKLTSANERAIKLAQSEERAAEKTRRMAADLAGLRMELSRSGDASGELGRKISRLATDTRFAAEATDGYRRAANRAAAEAREQARAYDRVADNARQAARAVSLLGAAAALPNGKRGGGLGGIAGMLGGISEGFLKQGLGGAGAAVEGTLGTPVLGPALLAGGAAAAVPLGAFAGAAVGGGIGGAGALGAAGLGLAGAWQSDPPKFEHMWTSSIDKVKKRWIDSSAGFGDELEESLKTADTLLRNLPIEKVLAQSQSFVAPIVTGAAQGTGSAANGFADSLAKAQPIIDKIGPKIANLGHDIGDAFRIISEGSAGGADALGDLVDGIGYAVKATATLILGFENAYESIRGFVIGANEVATTMPGVGVAILGLESSLFHIGTTSEATAKQLGGVKSAAHDTSYDWGEMGAAAADAAISALGLNDALTDLRNTQLGMADANLAVAQGWIDLKKELEEGARTLDTTTQAGVDNTRGIEDQVKALERQREQTIANGDQTQASIDQANAAFDANIEKLRAAAYAAGLNHQQVDALIASLGVASKINATPSVQVSGLSSALAQGESLRQRLDQIDGRVAVADVVVRYHTQGQALNAPLRTGGIGHAAAGGGQSGLTEVGEDGPELVRLPQGSMVYPRANRNQMTARGGDGSRIAIDWHITGYGALYEIIMAGMRSGDIQVPDSAIVSN